MSTTHVLTLLGAALVAPPIAYALVKLVRYVRGDRELRRSMRQAFYVRRKWLKHAHNLGLFVKDTSPRFPLLARLFRRSTLQLPDVAQPARIMYPPIRIRSDRYGVIVKARTIPGVGLVEWQKHDQHLADAWGCARVSVDQDRPGLLRVRGIRRDPLTEPTTHTPTGQPPASLDRLTIGVDEYAEPVDVRLSGVPGMGIFGLPGYGKTSLLNRMIADLAPSPVVQFALLDGKGEGVNVGADYEDLTGRAYFHTGDDLEAANAFFQRLEQLRAERAASIRDVLGCKNVWTALELEDGSRAPGFSRDWPLVVVVVDECHTYFQTVRDNGPKDPTRERNILASQNAQLAENLVKKQRAVGILLVLATQKGTGDALPTAIRDVCPVSLSFACRTAEAAKAALGEDIKDYPHANPTGLMDPEYIGVAAMGVQGRRGFTRVRTPFTREDATAQVCDAFAHLTADPFQLLPRRSLAAVRSIDSAPVGIARAS